MEVLKLHNKSNPGSAVSAACPAAAFIPSLLFQSMWRKIHFKSKLCLSLIGESWEGKVDLSKINLSLQLCRSLGKCLWLDCGLGFAGSGNLGQEFSSQVGNEEGWGT